MVNAFPFNEDQDKGKAVSRDTTSQALITLEKEKVVTSFSNSIKKNENILNLLDNEQLSKIDLRNQLLDLFVPDVEEKFESSTLKGFIKSELTTKYFFTKFFYIYLFKKIVEVIERLFKGMF